MESKKIDQLFREKLGQHQLEPNPESWQLVNDQIQPKTRPMVWMSIAASVTILAVAAFFLLGQHSEGIVDGHLANAPETPASEMIAWPSVTIESYAVASTQELEVNEVQPSPRIGERPVEITMEEEVMEMPVALETIKTDFAQPIMASSDLLPNQTISFYQVEMTYLAGVQPEEDDRSGIERLWAKAKETSPGEMWGSIRDKKNQLIGFNKN